ncbi:MAG: ABC transporter substrate-binding protein [Clostridia bacterium]|nr:ABC transporter substrate-binding protein [Clostridia bacterium]
MKKLLSLLLIALLVLSLTVGLVSCGEKEDEIQTIDTPYKGTTLYVYNWGENIANGEDGSLNLEKTFEKIYGINVVYTTYASNEEMYTKISSGTVSYDVIIPSDYMIARLIEEDLVQKINYDNIPNYKNIADQYKYNLFYDCGGKDGMTEYSAAYTVGMVGIIYNTKYVDEADVADHSWNLLWNEKYSGKILQFDNPRDAFGVAMYRDHLNVNSTDRADWEQAYRSILEQKPLLKGFVMDEIYEEMEGENSYIGAYYAGDCLTMLDNNENLDFFYPVEGTNVFVDAMCIPKNAKNVGAAELWINFLLETEYAIENSLYICYASPNKTVYESAEYREELGDDYYSILYDIPEQYKKADGTLDTTIAQYFYNQTAEIKAVQAELWNLVK